MRRISRNFPVLALLGRTAQIWLRHVVPMTLLSLAWAGLSVTIVLAPWATAGLFFATNRLAHNQRLSVRDVLDGVRRFAPPALAWGLVSALIWAGTFGAVAWRLVDRRGALAVLLVLIGLVWTLVQTFVWPLLFEQRTDGLLAALRSSLLMIVALPGYCLSLVALLVVLVGFSVSLRVPLLFFTPAYVALAANLAVIDRLAALGYAPIPAHTTRAG